VGRGVKPLTVDWIFRAYLRALTTLLSWMVLLLRELTPWPRTVNWV